MGTGSEKGKWDVKADGDGDGDEREREHTHTHTHTHVSLIPPWEDQREWHRMTSMTRPDYAVMYNLINTHTHTHTHTHTLCRV